jgi:predicted CoA-binding protein
VDPTIYVNQKVDVVPIFRAHASEVLVCVPWKMKFGIQEIIFTQFGMRHPTAKGKRMIHVFEMSDGVNDYRLEFDAERLNWTLVSMVEGSHV